MRVISVQQPWAQLIVDRRRHIVIKGEEWADAVKPGEHVAIHASHVINRAKCEEFEYNPEVLQKNAILGVVEVKRCFPRLKARTSKFDYHSGRVDAKKLYAIAVRTLEKFRKPIPIAAPLFIKGQTTWEY